jgi:hypothetical protein
MRAALAALLLLALAPVQAQLIVEKPKPAAKEKAAQKPATRVDGGRPAEQHPRHPSHQPAARPPQTRETSQGTVKLDRTERKSQPATTPPSPAQQYQQQQFEQRQPQTQTQQVPQNRVVQCTARPVCGGAGYGRCAAVSQTFPGMTAQAGRREIVQRCIEANTPDSCNCAAQCTAVARCSIF